MSQAELPPGWSAQWDESHQRYLFVQVETGHSQWEPPFEVPSEPMHDPHAAAAPTGRRRQYATEQLHAYDNAAPPASYSDGAYGQTAPAGGTMFTPGLAADPSQQYYGGTVEQNPQFQPAYGQQPPMQAYPQQPHPQNPQQIAGQFSQMSLTGQKPFALHTANLAAAPPNPLELRAPPPEIRLAPGSSLTDNPMSNADPSYMRCTLNAIPSTHQLLAKTKIPFSIVLSPHRTLKSDTTALDDPPVPVVSDAVIARCRRCRTYINPYVTFVDGGRKWQCCMCNYPSNEVPEMFDWDQARGIAGDRWARPELTHSVVEFIATQEYMVRAPQPLLYVFLIDVSHSAVQNGMVATAARALLESLDRIPNTEQRTLVSFVAYDTALYFFSLPPNQADPSMLVVADVDEVFLPKPSKELVFNLTESRVAVESLLERLPAMFQENQIIGSALGPALQAGLQLASATGGKLMALSSSLPSVGVGALKNRDDPKLLGTPKESTLLQAGSPFYKSFPIDASRAQVSVDMFLFGASYMDVATLTMLPHYTSGQTFFYPGFNAVRPEDAIKFAHEFGETLGSEIGLEGVLRVRASRGLLMSAFHGNFFTRSSDLLALPAVPQDQNYAVEVTIEESQTNPLSYFQAAVLHSSCHGERRIRVVTLAIPTTSNISEVYACVDQAALTTFTAIKAVERTQTHSLESARDYVQKGVTDILTAYRANMMSGGAGAAAGLAVPVNMQMFPLLSLALLKHVALRQSSQIAPDLRAYAQFLLGTLPTQTLIPYLYPSLYSLHNMPDECGTIGEEGVILPPPLPLTFDIFERHGLYLIEDGQAIFLWIGRDAVPQLIADVFDLPAYDALRGGKFTLPILENQFSQRVSAIVGKIRSLRRGPFYPSLYVVKEDGEPQLRLWALSALIHDRGDQTPSYQQWLGQLKDKINGSSY